MRRIIACTLAVFSVFIAFGHNSADSVKVYFRVNRANFDPLLGGNAASLDSFVNKIRVAADARELGYITIRAYASPEGPLRVNNRLSEERSKTVADYIINRTGIASDLIRIKPEGVAWDELRRVVAGNPDVPRQSQVLDILDNTPLWIFDSKGRVVDGRKKRLMSLAGGVPYRWLFAHVFPQLRNALAVSVCFKPDSCDRQPAADTADTLRVVDRGDTVSVVTPDTLRHSVDGEPSDTALVQQPVTAEHTVEPRYLFALKTNMLYYAALMPNLELEYLFSDRWSVAVEGDVAWWGRYSRNKSYRIAIVTPEVRHWIKPRSPWHGMYVGLFAGGGWYDFLSGSSGCYGEGVMAGASFGYMWPIGKRLSLEAALGAGYMHTRFKEYEPYEGHHVYQRTKALDYFGPLKLKLSIAWRFLDRNKSKRIKPEI